jgi:hypothetical protein
VIRKHHTLKCRAVTDTEIKLAFLKEASFFMCLWTIFRITFYNSLPEIDKRLIGRKFLRNFRSLPGFGNVINFASFQGFVKWDSRRQSLNECTGAAGGTPSGGAREQAYSLINICLRHLRIFYSDGSRGTSLHCNTGDFTFKS